MVIKTPLVVVEQKLIVAGHYTTILYLQEQQLSLVCVLNPENTAFLCRVQTDNVCLQSKFLQHAE